MALPNILAEAGHKPPFGRNRCKCTLGGERRWAGNSVCRASRPG